MRVDEGKTEIWVSALIRHLCTGNWNSAFGDSGLPGKSEKNPNYTNYIQELNEQWDIPLFTDKTQRLERLYTSCPYAGQMLRTIQARVRKKKTI
jgi:hypothetical protein